MDSGYARVAKWRKKRKNIKYHADFMRGMRQKWRKAFLKGKVSYDDVPKAYRYWKEPQA